MERSIRWFVIYCFYLLAAYGLLIWTQQVLSKADLHPLDTLLTAMSISGCLTCARVYEPSATDGG
jgi:hypothetical protein